MNFQKPIWILQARPVLLHIVLNFLISSESRFVLQGQKLKPYSQKSMAIVFSATVFNGGTDSDDKNIPVRLEMIHCCQLKNDKTSIHTDDGTATTAMFNKSASPTGVGNNISGFDCESMVVHSGLAHYIPLTTSSNLTAFFLNKHLLNRKGYCKFRIHGTSPTDIPAFKIDFDTQENIEKFHAKKCEYLDQDPLNGCKPVNCIEKYTGFRSFYNAELNLCEATPLCESLTVASDANNSKVDHEEHFPSFVLDIAANKCVKKSSIKSVKQRDALLGSEERDASTGVFAAAYGLSLTKLALAIFFSVLFVMCVCVGFHSLCTFCDCDICFLQSRKSPSYTGKNKTKYLPIKNEEDLNHNTANDDTIIQEIKYRREMSRQNFNNGGGSINLTKDKQSDSPTMNKTRNGENSLNQWNPTSKNQYQQSESLSRMSPKSGVLTTESQNSPNISKTPSPVLSYKSMDPQSETKSNRPEEFVTEPVSQSTRKFPHINNILSRLSNIRSKKSQDLDESIYLRKDLLRAYGHNSNKFDPNNNQSSSLIAQKNAHTFTQQPQEIPDANGRIIKMKTTPRFNAVIHKIQEPDYSEMAGPAHRAVQNPAITQKQSSPNNSNNNNAYSRSSNYNSPVNPSMRIKSKASLSLEGHCNSDRDANANTNGACRNNDNGSSSVQSGRQELNFGNWKNIPSADSFNRFYKSEMAQAANFLRDLDQKRWDSPLLEQSSHSNQFESYSYSSHCDTPESPGLIRKIKELPIPLYMTHSKAKLAVDSSTPEETSKNPSRSKLCASPSPTSNATMGGHDQQPFTNVDATNMGDEDECFTTEGSPSVSGRSSLCHSSRRHFDTDSEGESDTDEEDEIENADVRVDDTTLEIKNKASATTSVDNLKQLTVTATASTNTELDLKLEEAPVIKISSCHKATETLEFQQPQESFPLLPSPSLQLVLPGEEVNIQEKEEEKKVFSPAFDFGKPITMPMNTHFNFSYPPMLEENNNSQVPSLPVASFPSTSRSHPNKSSVAESIYMSALRFRNNVSSYNYHFNLLNNAAVSPSTSQAESGINETRRPELFESETDNDNAASIGEFLNGASEVTSSAHLPSVTGIEREIVNEMARMSINDNFSSGPNQERERERFEINKPVNSQHLIHSPPTLTTSETNSNSSWSDYRINPDQAMDACFFDNEMLPLRRPSASDEMLLKRYWIDTYSHRRNT